MIGLILCLVGLLIGLMMELCNLLFLGPLLLLGGLFRLLDRITGAVPGTPTEDRGAKLFVALCVIGSILVFVYLYLISEGAPDLK